MKKPLRILSFFIFPAFVFFLSLFLSSVFDLYNVLWWFDIPMHFLGGVSVGYMSVLFLRFWKEENLIQIRSKFLFVLIVVCAVSFIAVLWEFWEYFMVNYFNLDWNLGYEDSLFDLLMGMLGGLSVGVFSKV